MEVMMKQRFLVWMSLLLVFVVLISASTGCEDETEKMAQQQLAMQRQRQASQPKPANNTPTANADQQISADGDAGDAATEDGEQPVEEYTGPKVDVNILEVKAPYPEFTGDGRYTIKIEVSSQELLQRAVWDILFFDEEDNEVASDRQDLKIPMGDHPMILKFPSLSCSAMPVRVELRQTELQAAEGEETSENQQSGAGDSAKKKGGSNSGPGIGTGNLGTQDSI